MKPTFIYQKRLSEAFFYAFCGSPLEATEVRLDIGNLCGHRIEQKDDLVFVQVDIDRFEEALIELETDGYPTEDEDDVDLEEDESD